MGAVTLAATMIMTVAAWAPEADAVEPAPSMAVGGLTSQPIGHYQFCQRKPAECAVRTRPAAAPRVTDFGWDVVREVNTSVNHAIEPHTDREMYGVEEVWSYPELKGDCEDYVLLKRHLLMERGFDPNDLLITVVRKRDGEGHAVLTLRTAEGDFILDNLDDRVRLWTETPYYYLKRQASFDSGRLVAIDHGRDIAVGALD
jgi:predicted transglutaminase-like cysteine proteinase